MSYQTYSEEDSEHRRHIESRPLPMIPGNPIYESVFAPTLTVREDYEVEVRYPYQSVFPPTITVRDRSEYSDEDEEDVPYHSVFPPTLTVRDRSEYEEYDQDEEEDLEDLEDFYLDDQERQEVHINILDMRLSREREQEALDAIPHLVYDPEYVSGFNETFKTGARRVFEQAMAKIHTWAKYGDPMY